MLRFYLFKIFISFWSVDQNLYILISIYQQFHMLIKLFQDCLLEGSKTTLFPPSTNSEADGICSSFIIRPPVCYFSPFFQKLKQYSDTYGYKHPHLGQPFLDHTNFQPELELELYLNHCLKGQEIWTIHSRLNSLNVILENTFCLISGFPVTQIHLRGRLLTLKISTPGDELRLITLVRRLITLLISVLLVTDA